MFVGAIGEPSLGRWQVSKAARTSVQPLMCRLAVLVGGKRKATKGGKVREPTNMRVRCSLQSGGSQMWSGWLY